MPIRDHRALFSAAEDSLNRHGGKLQHLLMLYLAIISGLTLLSAALTVALSSRIENTGGLSNMGLRSILSTAQAVLPMVQTVVLAGLQLGYTRAALNARRNQHFDHDTLFGGFRAFLPMMTAYLLQGLMYAGLALAAMYAATYIFLMLPASGDFQALMMPALQSMSALSNTVTLDEATMQSASQAVMPVLWIFLLVFIPLFLPTYYRYRMVMFRLVDQPRPRPVLAMQESRVMLHRSRFALLKIDLRLWWYYALQLLVTAVCYGDTILYALGIPLPFSADVSYFLFLILSLVLQFVLFYFTMNRVTLTYAAAYEELLAAFEEKKAEIMQKMNLPSQKPHTPWDDQYEA